MSLIFFFNDTATTEIYTLSLHDALPICADRDGGDMNWRRTLVAALLVVELCANARGAEPEASPGEWKFISDKEDRKSTRLNSSHSQISYAVFCLKKKNRLRRQTHLGDAA